MYCEPSNAGLNSETHAVAKEMEAAAVAWVCQRMGVAFTALKVITDLVDEPETTSGQFYRNLAWRRSVSP